MTDDQAASPANEGVTDGTATVRCPWCSTVSPAGTETCPSCGAALVASGDAAVPGVTSIDPEAILRGRTDARGRSGILGFLVGDDAVEVPSEAELERLAPPASDVRLEIARLEIHAERQRLEATQAALAAEAAVKGGERIPDSDTIAAALEASADDDTIDEAPSLAAAGPDTVAGPGAVPAATPPPGPETGGATAAPPPGPDATVNAIPDARDGETGQPDAGASA